MRNHIIILALLAVVTVSCKKEKNLSKIPVISDLQMFPDSVRSASNFDTVFISFTINDGDGDLSNDSADIYIKEIWGNNKYQYTFPEIPRDIADADKGLVAACTIKIPASLYLIINPAIPAGQSDSAQFEIFIKDEARNQSNTLKTPVIHILP
jgi:hypothetical protein